jgi:hypothetical protein
VSYQKGNDGGMADLFHPQQNVFQRVDIFVMLCFFFFILFFVISSGFVIKNWMDRCGCRLLIISASSLSIFPVSFSNRSNAFKKLLCTVSCLFIEQNVLQTLIAARWMVCSMQRRQAHIELKGIPAASYQCLIPSISVSLFVALPIMNAII